MCVGKRHLSDLYILESIRTTLFRADYDLRWWHVLEKVNLTFSSCAKEDKQICTSLSAVFHRVSPLQQLRRVLASTAWQMQRLVGLIVKCVPNDTNRSIYIHTQVSFTLLPARLRVGSDILSRLVCLVCNYTSSRVLHRATSFCHAQSINLACHRLFLRRADISISREWRRRVSSTL